MNLCRHIQPTPSVKLTVCTMSLALVLTAFTGSALAKGKPGGGGGGGGGGDTASIQMVAEGVLLAAQECTDKLAASSSDLLCNKSGYQIMLGDYFVDRNYDNGHGSVCFNNGIWDWVTIQLWENDDGSAETWFRWHAPDTRGNDVLYVLEVHGAAWSDDFPPLSAGSITMHGTSWELRATNKRQSRNACTGQGSFNSTDYVDVELIRNP